MKGLASAMPWIVCLLWMCTLIPHAGAQSQTTWSALDIGWYRDEACTIPLASNPNNVPKTVGSERIYVRTIEMSPIGLCTDGLGHAILHQAEVYPTISRNPSSTSKSWLATFLTKEKPCNWTNPYFTTYWTTIPDSSLYVDYYYLRWTYEPTEGSVHSWTSFPLIVFLTHPDVADIHTSLVDIHDEKTICAGQTATVSFRVLNGGELTVPNATVALYSAANSNMTEDAQFIASFSLGSVHGGAPITDYVRTFTFPNYTGTRWFALKAIAADVPFKHTPWGWSDKIAKTPDISFTSKPWIWISPTSSPASAPTAVPAEGVMMFQYQYENKGTWPTAATTAIQVEIKRKNGSWQAVPNAVWNVGVINCNSGVITSPIQQVILTGELANEDDYGKVRAIRLKFVNTGESNSLTNNKSKSKDILVIAPLVHIEGAARVTAGGVANFTAVDGLPGAQYEWTLDQSTLPFGNAAAMLDLIGNATSTWTGVAYCNVITWQAFAQSNIMVKLKYTSPSGAVVEIGKTLFIWPLPAIQVVYKAFIKWDAMDAPYAPELFGFIAGDDRDFSLSPLAETSRTKQIEFISTEGLNESLAVRESSPSHRYLNCEQDGTLTWCETTGYHKTPLTTVICGPEYGQGVPSATIQGLLVPEQGLFAATLQASAGPGCMVIPVPEIDYKCKVIIRQLLAEDTGLMGPMEFRVESLTDGFPWHEMFVNGFPIFLIDPCEIEADVLELASNLDYVRYWPEPSESGWSWAIVPGLSSN